MPCFVVTREAHRAGQTVNAVLSDPTVSGFPNPRTAVAVKATISEHELRIDDEPRPRQILSNVGENGVTTIMCEGSSKNLRNRERRAALERASALLKQAGSALMALKADSDEPETVTGALGELWNWVNRERERATAATHDDVSAPIG